MSESEKLQRQEYKKRRKKWIIVQIIALSIVSFILLGSLYIYDKMNQTYYIEYTEKGSVDYKVHLKENDFFEDEWVESDRAYISALIDNVLADFSYRLNMDAENVGFDYSYRIDAQIVVSDNHSGEAIFNPIYELVPEKTGEIDSGKAVMIKEQVAIDYVKYNEIASSFTEIYRLKDVTSVVKVTLFVEVISRCEEFEQNSENSYSLTLDIPLANNTLSIEMSSSVPEAERKVLACAGTINQDIFKTTAIVAAILDLLLACFFVGFVYLTRNDDINYTIKVQKLVSAYRSFIQQMDGEFDTEGYQIIRIKTFNEMLGIRDTIQSPILMFENKDQTMTEFVIPTNTKLLYAFDIKVDNYDELYGLVPPEVELVVDALEEEPEAEPEVEAPECVEEPIILAENVDEEALEEALATPDVVLSEIEYVEDDDEDYEETEEEPGVEVIGVVWPERAHKNKVYRYDPNGEKLTNGDVVLVPSRDAARNRDIIRKAAVAHGNHKVDPEHIHHPLKKIIGVVKRKAEQALTPKAED